MNICAMYDSLVMRCNREPRAIPEATRMVRFPHGLKNPFHYRVLAQSAFIGDVMKSRIQVIFFTINFSAHVIKCLSPEILKQNPFYIVSNVGTTNLKEVHVLCGWSPRLQYDYEPERLSTRMAYKAGGVIKISHRLTRFRGTGYGLTARETISEKLWKWENISRLWAYQYEGIKIKENQAVKDTG